VIARDLDVPASEAIFVVSAYQIAVTAALLPLATLGEILGSRHVEVAGDHRQGDVDDRSVEHCHGDGERHGAERQEPLAQRQPAARVCPGGAPTTRGAASGERQIGRIARLQAPENGR
jgi:hypothetical protein